MALNTTDLYEYGPGCVIKRLRRRPSAGFVVITEIFFVRCDRNVIDFALTR